MELPGHKRKPTPEELKLLDRLINLASLSIKENRKDLILVESLNDGGMGSIHLYPDGVNYDGREFGKQISDIVFRDKDGIDIIATLYLDQYGDLFEIDVWKTDFAPTISLNFESEN